MTEEPGNPLGGHGFTQFDFICTDKGQHREFALRAVMVRAGSADFFDVAEYVSFHPAGRQSMFGGAPEFDEFFCARCGRNPRINHHKLAELVERLLQLGITVLDISRLPF